jgi:hypothetical protein
LDQHLDSQHHHTEIIMQKPPKFVPTAEIEAGLHVDNADQCPLLVAEHTVIKARRALVDAMVPTTGLTADKLLNSGMENFNKYVDITLELLAQFVKSADEILAPASHAIKPRH